MNMKVLMLLSLAVVRTEGVFGEPLPVNDDAYSIDKNCVESNDPNCTTNPLWQGSAASGAKPIYQPGLYSPTVCGQWDCDCALLAQSKSCCCIIDDLQRYEDHVWRRGESIYNSYSELLRRIQELKDSRVAFTAIMLPTVNSCYGPFTVNIPVPYRTALLNRGNAFNPALGIFTAPRKGLYVFSYVAYSNSAVMKRSYASIALMKNSDVIVSVWEDNKEDSEDSGSHGIILLLNGGDQVYIRLHAGRYLCNIAYKANEFSGFLLTSL
ncbi:cerebellin-4-like isoform X2 [Ambystoma mexicanum]